MMNRYPLISFSFDDFPISAYQNGGGFLLEQGAASTYYLTISLMGQNTEMGPIVQKNDLETVIENGCEVGCHTYDHIDALKSNAQQYQATIQRNQSEFSNIIPKMTFETFAYPYGTVTPETKEVIQKHFLGGRGGRQTINCNRIDLNLIHSFFLDERLHLKIEDIQKIIDENDQKNGWLVFSTHDIQKSPSRYGCMISKFKSIVKYACSSDAEIVTVKRGIEIVTAGQNAKPDISSFL